MDGVNQGHLVKALEVLFPANKTILNARKQTDLKYPNGSYLELDIWIPNIKLGFEFQDDYHYVTTWYVQKSKDKIQTNVKRFILHQEGICVIDVPCWWDGTIESLAATILFHRPDLHFPDENASPIPLDPPFTFFPMRDIPGVGELMLASFPMDSKANTLSISSNTWWMGEKFDGIRCCWNPLQQSVFTRGCNELNIPATITEYLPPIFIDGEFWFGRGQYTGTYMLFKGAVENVSWQFLRMMTFDNPASNLQGKPFEERYESLLTSIPSDHLFNIIVMRILCTNNLHMSEMIDGVLEDGGEGVILRKVGSMYEHGRTPALVKLKTAFGDKEGIVVAFVAKNRSVVLKLPNGETFEVPEESVLVKVRVGDVVSFSYESHSRRDVPVNPKIYRVRSDLAWEDVLYNSAKERTFLNDPSRVADYKSKPLGHWTKKTMRNFMEKFAKHFKLDPLVPETWYRLQFHSIRKYKGGMAIMQKFKGYVNAVRSLFPDVKFDNSAFMKLSWYDIRNRRKFFEDYANKHRFDPLKPENWYRQPKDRIKATKGAYGVLSYHKLSIFQALTDLFPNIGLDRTRFQAKTAWWDESNRREFFEDFARTSGFDPLHANLWYPQYSKLTSAKGIYSVIHHHGYSISKALMSLFPEVQFDRTKFQSKAWTNKNSSLWNSADDRRRFFVEYAIANKFDPLVPEKWYSEPRERIMAATGAFRVMHHHNRSVAQALADLFPEIGIDKSKFLFHASWSNKDRRRKFLEDYAKDHGFDPLIPSHWYSHPAETLTAEKGVASIVYYHNKSVITALLELFPEIGFDRTALKIWRFKKPMGSWESIDTRRKLFEDYASEKGFDSHNPEHWYAQRREDIIAVKGAMTVIGFHGNSLSQALMDLFPNIGLHRSKFSWVTSVWADKGNRREFFRKYAEGNGFDPNDPEQWYIQPRDRIMATKGASRVMYYHSNSIAHALMDLFPNIGLEKSKLLGKAKSSSDVREFFMLYAATHNFDAKSPNNWYSEPRDRIHAYAGANQALSSFGGNVEKALLHAFPDIGLERTRFNSEWNDESRQRQLFIQFANENKFDPLDPETWYAQQKESLLHIQGMSKVISLHEKSLQRALIDLFPDIGLDISKLWPKKSSFGNADTRRAFFETYAQANGFDPLVPDNWYSQPFDRFMDTAGAHRVIFYHKNKMSDALLDLFPEIGLDKVRLRANCVSYPPIFR